MQFLDLEGLKSLWVKIQKNATDTASAAIDNIGLKAIATSGKASDVNIDAIAGVTGTTAQQALSDIYSQLTDVKTTADAAKKSADSWVDKFVSSGTYNATTKQIELTIANGDAVKFDVSDLLDNVNFDGSNIILTGYTAGTSDAAIVDTDSLNAAIGKLVNQISAIKTTADNTTDALSKQSITVTEKTDADPAKVTFVYATSGTTTKSVTIEAISDDEIENIVNPKA